MGFILEVAFKEDLTLIKWPAKQHGKVTRQLKDKNTKETYRLEALSLGYEGTGWSSLPANLCSMTDPVSQVSRQESATESQNPSCLPVANQEATLQGQGLLQLQVSMEDGAQTILASDLASNE